MLFNIIHFLTTYFMQPITKFCKDNENIMERMTTPGMFLGKERAVLLRAIEIRITTRQDE